MTDSRVLTHDEIKDRAYMLSGDVPHEIIDHDAAQREEIDRLKERLKEALERLQKPSDTDDYNESWASRTFSEVFGQEGK
jgi:hypothetical protein